MLTIRLSIILFFFKNIFQVTIDCLSVPRCPGNLLKTFRYHVLLTALSLSKASNTCPHLHVETLQGYVAGTCTFKILNSSFAAIIYLRSSNI